jgi:hypothetical protein
MQFLAKIGATSLLKVGTAAVVELLLERYVALTVAQISAKKIIVTSLFIRCLLKTPGYAALPACGVSMNNRIL